MTMRVGSAHPVVMVTSRATLRLPFFDQATSPHPSTGEGFNQGLATSCLLPLEFFCYIFEVCLSHPYLYPQQSFIYCSD